MKNTISKGNEKKVALIKGMIGLAVDSGIHIKNFLDMFDVESFEDFCDIEDRLESFIYIDLINATRDFCKKNPLESPTELDILEHLLLDDYDVFRVMVGENETLIALKKDGETNENI